LNAIKSYLGHTELTVGDGVVGVFLTVVGELVYHEAKELVGTKSRRESRRNARYFIGYDYIVGCDLVVGCDRVATRA
jgi:hypothetical protein